MEVLNCSGFSEIFNDVRIFLAVQLLSMLKHKYSLFCLNI